MECQLCFLMRMFAVWSAACVLDPTLAVSTYKLNDTAVSPPRPVSKAPFNTEYTLVVLKLSISSKQICPRWLSVACAWQERQYFVQNDKSHLFVCFSMQCHVQSCPKSAVLGFASASPFTYHHGACFKCDVYWSQTHRHFAICCIGRACRHETITIPIFLVFQPEKKNTLRINMKIIPSRPLPFF